MKIIHLNKDWFKNKRGFVLVTAFMLMVIMMFLGFYFIDLMWSESLIAKSQATSAKGYYLSEAGIEEAVWKLKYDETWKNNFETDPNWYVEFTRENDLIVGGSYTIQVQNTDLAKGEITSTGSLLFNDQTAQRVVKTKVFKAMGQASLIGDNALLTDSGIEVSGTLMNVQNGSIFSNEDIELHLASNVSVQNDASAVDEIYISLLSQLNANQKYCRLCEFFCSCEPAPDPIAIPPVDFDSADPNSFKSQAQSQGQVYSETEFENMLNNDPNLIIEGITYVTGRVKIKRGQHLTINGALATDGKIEIGDSMWPLLNNARLTVNYTEGQPAGILSKSGIEVGLYTSSVNIQGLVYAIDSVELISLAELFSIEGGMIARKFEGSSLWQSINFNFNEQIITDTIGGIPTFSPTVTIEHWEEEY